MYSGSRYEGAIVLEPVQDVISQHVSISELQFRFYFAKAGADETKYLTFYRATSNTVSGSIASMRGSLIGAIAIPHAYNSSPAVILNSETNAEMFNNMVSYFQSGGEVLIIYVPTTRGTHSSGYCYDYLQITDVYLRVVYDKLYDTGVINSSPIVFGSQSTMTIHTYDERYYHKVTWSFGEYSHTETVSAGTLTASYTVP